MNISEQQAKEIIDFLVHKIDPCARWRIDKESGFVINWYCKANKNPYWVPYWVDTCILYVASDIEISNISCYFRKSMTSSTVLKMLLELSSRQPIYAGSAYNSGIYVFMQKGTTLEQILIDMDLSVNV